MGRAKLDMHLIGKEKSRHTTFKKRKEGLVRKIHEFTTLCDVNACMIIHPPKHENYSAETEIWPENPGEVSRIISIFKANSDVSGSRNFALSDFYHCRKKKVQEELEKERKKRMEMVYPTWIDSMSYLPETQLRDFATTLGNKLGFVKCRIEAIKGSSSDHFRTAAVPQNRVLIMDAPPPLPQPSHPQQLMMIDNYNNSNGIRLPPAALVQRNMEWVDVSAPPVNPNETHLPLLQYQANMDHQEHHHHLPQQQQIHPVNPSSMMGLLINENDHYHHGTTSNCNIQYASFKQEILYASPSGGGGVGPTGVLENAGLYGYPMPLPRYHSQTLQPQQMGSYLQYPSAMSEVLHIQPNLQSSKGKEYSDFFQYSMKDYNKDERR